MARNYTLIIFVAINFIALFLIQSFAFSREEPTGHDLFNYCLTREKTMQMYCLISIDSIVQSHLMTLELLEAKKTAPNAIKKYSFCLPKDYSIGLIADAVTKELAERPDLRPISAPLFVVSALKRHFPCNAIK